MLKAIIQSSAVLGLAIGASMVNPSEPVQAASFSKNCGALNQKTCISVNPAKWCKSGLKVKRQPGRNICVRKEKKPDRREPCGGLNQKTCISANPAKWCEDGLKVKHQPGRNICVKKERKPDRTPGSSECGGLNQIRCQSPNPAKWCDDGFRNKVVFGAPDICVAKREKRPCGGLNQDSCVNINPAKWCDKGLTYKPRMLIGKRGTCIKKVRNADRIAVAAQVIEELGDNNPLANLTKCIKRPSKLGDLKTAISTRSNNGVNRVLRSCGADLNGLQNMGKLASLNNGTQAGEDKKFKTLSITVGASGAAGVAGAAGAGIVIELKKGPNARWFFTGGVGGGPKAEVVGDVTVGLSRSQIPTSRWGFDHGIGAVVSGHYIVGLSGGVEFEGNSLNFAGISFGAGGGVGVGGAVYKTGAIFPFKDL
ncbi:MAG: hypothetical protein AAF250_10660 [Pseudomonadota bacterium]